MPALSIAFQINKRASDYVALAKHIDQYGIRHDQHLRAPFHFGYVLLLLTFDVSAHT